MQLQFARHLTNRAAVGLLGLACALPALAQIRSDQMPPEAEGIQIDEQIGIQVPADLTFFDENGAPVTLARYFDGRRPVVLTLNYFGCPMICGLQLQGLLGTLKDLPWTPGNEFRVLTVSFEPREGPSLAFAKKQAYIAEYGRPDAAAGWHFLTGSQDSIRTLTRTVGFNYKWNSDRNEWSHSTALILLTPTGRVARYLGGLSYDPNTLKMSLVEASEGKVGSLADQFFQWCFHWDPVAGKYAVTAKKVMTFAGAGMVLLLGSGLLFFWRREFRRNRRGATVAAEPALTTPPDAAGST